MRDFHSWGRHSRERGRRDQLHWMMGLGSTVAALAAVAAVVVVRTTPTVSFPASFQIGPTLAMTHTSSTVVPSPTTTEQRTTQKRAVVIVTPEAPISDSDDRTGATPKDDESSPTPASQN